MELLEIIKESAKAHKYIFDILENVELDQTNKNELITGLNALENLYNKTYSELKNKNIGALVCADVCPHCKANLFISDLISYDFVCFNCDENYYNCEI